MDLTDFLDQLLTVLHERGVHFCAIGGAAVNAYVEPVVTLDVALAVAASDLATAEEALAARFRLEKFLRGLNVSTVGSDVRVRIQIDPGYAAFTARARIRPVLGIELPVAALEDVLDGKVWAVQDPSRSTGTRRRSEARIEHESFLRLQLVSSGRANGVEQEVPALLGDRAWDNDEHVLFE